jgi:hypothetical protein
MSNIIEFKIPYIVLSAVCINCEATWTARISQTAYNRYVKKNAKAICPCCGHVDVGFAGKLSRDNQ